MRAKLNRRAVAVLPVKSKPYDCRDVELKGFLLRVQPKTSKSPQGRKTWYFQYRTREQRQTRVKLGNYPGLSPEAARAIALQQATDVAKGIDLVKRKRTERNEGVQARQRTLRAFIDGRYEPWARLHLKSAEFQVARLRSDFADWLDRPMTSLVPFAVEGLRQRWKKGGMQPQSINRDIQRLQSVLSRAVAWQVLDRHPFADIRPLKADKTGRVRFLTAAEEATLIKALADRETGLKSARQRFNAWRVARGFKPLAGRRNEFVDHLRPMTLLALNTGLRRGELLALRWRDINLGAKTLTVQAAGAKSGHTRYLPLNASALTVLTTWHRLHTGGSDEDLIFPGQNGQRMKRIDTAWRGLMIRAKIKDFRFHDCRHHFASRLVQRGVDLYTVKELLGHSAIEMTEKYSHLAPDNLRAAVERAAI